MEKNEVVMNRYGFYQLAEIPSQEELNDYYANKYYQDDSAIYFHEYSQEELLYIQNKIEQKASILDKWVQPLTGKPKLLDVGCGEGFTLSFFHKKGWEVKGIDFSNYGCKQHNASMIPYLVEGDIYKKMEEISNQKEVYDCIWLDNVLEHVVDPEELLIKLSKITHSGTVMVIEVPNDFSVLQNKLLEKGIINRAFWIANPDHISYFNLNGLQNLISACGFDNKQAIADFPIDFNLANSFANYVMNKETGKGGHKQRMFIENLMHEISPELTNQLYQVLAQMGLGRTISVFLMPNSNNKN